MTLKDTLSKHKQESFALTAFAASLLIAPSQFWQAIVSRRQMIRESRVGIIGWTKINKEWSSLLAIRHVSSELGLHPINIYKEADPVVSQM